MAQFNTDYRMPSRQPLLSACLRKRIEEARLLSRMARTHAEKKRLGKALSHSEQIN